MRNIISVTRVFLSRALSWISLSRRKKPVYSLSEDLRQPAPPKKQIDNVAIVREAVAKRLNKKPHKLSDEDYKKVTQLTFDMSMMSDLTPLNELKNLKVLWLDHPQVSDLTPLKNLKNLQQLYLTHMLVSDLTPLKELNNLHTLNIENTKVSDLTPLKDLKNLLRFYLKYTPVSDLTPLKNLNNLQLLELVGTKVSYEQMAALKMALPKLIIAR